MRVFFHRKIFDRFIYYHSIKPCPVSLLTGVEALKIGFGSVFLFDIIFLIRGPPILSKKFERRKYERSKEAKEKR